MKFVVVIGNVVDGFSFYGPFDNNQAAMNYAENFIDDWHVVVLHSPLGDDR